MLQPAPANIGEGGGGELQARGGEELLAHPVVDRPADPRGVARPVDGGVGRPVLASVPPDSAASSANRVAALGLLAAVVVVAVLSAPCEEGGTVERN